MAETIRTTILGIILTTFTLAAGLSLFASIILARSITKPVDALRKGTASLAAGELSHRVTVYSDDELGELANAFNTMAKQIEEGQAALAELASHDELTGLFNRRSFFSMLEGELARAERFNRSVTLVMIDIDHFKRVNDTHGHLAGDAALRGMSALLLQELRSIDRVCRYGGEEIAVILPEVDIAGATAVAERLRASIESRSFDINTEARLKMTVSIGVAFWPIHADNAEELVAAADSALYKAKNAGRNRVVRYNEQD